VHHDALRLHRICLNPYTCTALMLAHCLLHRCRHSRRRQSPLRARTYSLHACAIPARVHRARMPCTFLHLPCPYLRASSVCAQVPCFLCLHRFESSASCIRSARWVYTGALTHLSHNHWDPPPPSVMGLRCRHLHFCVAWPTQVDFVFSVTLYMHRQDLEPILPITQYSCMQLFSATHSHPLHGISANLEKLFPKYSSQSFADTREGVCIIHNPCALPIIASVSPKPIPCLFACFYESVSYVYVLFSTCLSNCVASAAWVVFGFVFISTFLFSFFFPAN